MEDGSTVEEAFANVQDKITFDSTPTAGSQNAITSGGVAAALAETKTEIKEAAEDALTAAENAARSAEEAEDAKSVILDHAYTYGTEDLIPGVTPLASGRIHFVYEEG